MSLFPSFMPMLSRASLAVGALIAAGLLLAVPVHATPAQALFITHNDANLEWAPCPEFFPEGCGIAVLQGDPGEPNADIFFRVPAGSELPKHWHTSAERMILVSGTLHLDFEGQPSRAIEPGTYIYGPAELPHSGHCDAGDPCILFIAFEQPVDAHPVAD